MSWCSNLEHDEPERKLKTRRVDKNVRRKTPQQRSVTFTKRRRGLFNKAAELCMLCDAQVAVLVSSPNETENKRRKFYCFGHTSVDTVFKKFLGAKASGPGQPLRAVAGDIDAAADAAVRRKAMALSENLKLLEAELSSLASNSNSNNKKRKRGSFLTERSVEDDLEAFENSSCIEELEVLVNGLDKVIDEANARVNSMNEAKPRMNCIEPPSDSDSPGFLGPKQTDVCPKFLYHDASPHHCDNQATEVDNNNNADQIWPDNQPGFDLGDLFGDDNGGLYFENSHFNSQFDCRLLDSDQKLASTGEVGIAWSDSMAPPVLQPVNQQSMVGLDHNGSPVWSYYNTVGL